MNNRIKTSLSLGLTLALCGGMAHAGNLSSPSEQRGYSNCVKQAEREYGNLNIKVEGTYFTYTRENTRDFFLNGSERVNGSWEPVRIKCEATRSGRRILASSIDAGTFQPRFEGELAAN